MKNLTLSLSTLILLMACSKPGVDKATIIIRERAPLTSSEINSLTTADTQLREIEAFKLLLKTKSPNFALAEFIGSALGKKQRTELAHVLEEVSGDDINQLIEAIERSNKEIRKNYLYHLKNYKDNKNITENALAKGEQSRESAFSFRNQMTVSAFSYMRSKALDEVVQSYEREASKVSLEVTQGIAMKMVSHPVESAEIENAVKTLDFEKAKKIISKNLRKAEVLNYRFNQAELGTEERYIALATETIARNIYYLIKESKEFKNVVAEIGRVQKKIDSVNKKVNEFIVLTATLESHIENTRDNFMSLGNGMKSAAIEMGQMYRHVEGKPKEIRTKRVVDYLSDKIYGGDRLKDPELLKADAVLRSKVESIESNLSGSMKAIGAISTNLSTILNTSKQLANLLGVKVSPEINKVIDKAQKIANVVSLGSKVVDVCTTGGAMTALSAFSGGSLLGGGGGENAAQIAQVNQKLDEVLENQRLMMKAQLETMAMIKNLAILVDEYHQEEMSALSELRDYNLISLEIQKASLVHPEIKSCEHLINYNLSSVWRDYNFQKLPFDNIDHIQMFKSNFKDRIVGMRGIRDFIEGTGTNDFIKCQQAFVKAFGVSHKTEDPLRAIFETTENNNLYKFNKNIYLPTLATVKKFSGENNLNSVPLHLPLKNMRHLDEKSEYLHSLALTGNFYDTQEDVYSLDNLISVKNLERYVTSLVLLHPLFELNQSDWAKSLDLIVNKHFDNSSYERKVKSQYFLSGALKSIQSSIAQEAMLAGEPIIPGLYKNYHKELLSNKSCEGVVRFRGDGKETDWELICALRSNTLLMKNYLAYAVYQKINLIIDYSDAYKNKDFQRLSEILNAPLDSSSFEESEGEIHVNLGAFKPLLEESSVAKIALPRPEKLHEGRITYSENMDRLLSMQESVIGELEKVHPHGRRDINLDLLARYMLRSR